MRDCTEIDNLFRELEATLPAVFDRQTVKRMLGNVIAPGYLANLDCIGEGPPRIRIGQRRVAYPRKPFLEWLRKRCQVIERCGVLTEQESVR